MTTAIADRGETAFAAVLADVLRVERVGLDSHFFDELGADSLVMAQFCARVRKRGDLPPVSMRDVYAHPTISGLAAAVADVAPASATPPAAAVADLPTPTNAREYLLCGALQALFYLGYSYLGVLAAVAGFRWVGAGSAGVASYLRLVLFGAAAFGVVSAWACHIVTLKPWKPPCSVLTPLLMSS